MLGLRSPVHSVVRMLNPASAATSIIGIFHPSYDKTHRDAGQFLQDRNLAVFKGEGGEAERNPDTACQVHMLASGELREETWPAIFGSRHLKDVELEVSRLQLLWRGDIEDEYGLAAVLGSAAIALRAMGRASSISSAAQMVDEFWQRRDRDFLGWD
jgi:anthranilate phosphoribosyltransferase